jgi:hypothetical protein
MNDFQVRILVLEKPDQSIVLFNEKAILGVMLSNACERAKAWANFKPAFSRFEFKLGDNPFREIFVV